MHPIGFSTGALAKSDFTRGVELQRNMPGIDAVELSALREPELPALVDAIPSLDLHAFEYVSIHAPGKLQTLDERTVFDLLQRVPESWPVIVHPELLQTPPLWRAMGSRLCLENMDHRKPTGRTPGELRALFACFPEASFCLDVGHARQVDPTMASAMMMLRESGDRLRQVHVSDVGPRGEHLPLGATARHAFAKIAHLIPAHCPLIIESMVPLASVERELEAVRAVFETHEAVYPVSIQSR